MTQDVVRYVKMRTPSTRGLERYKIVEIYCLESGHPVVRLKAFGPTVASVKFSAHMITAG